MPKQKEEQEADASLVQDFQKRAAKFEKEYQALCEKYGCHIRVTPAFVATNHGSFEITQSVSIGELPKAQNPL